MGSLRFLPGVSDRVSKDVHVPKPNMKEEITIWKALELTGGNIIYIEAPRWFEARMIDQSVFMAQREDIRLIELSKEGQFTPQQLADRGEEVYVMQFGPETRILGGLRIFASED